MRKFCSIISSELRVTQSVGLGLQADLSSPGPLSKESIAVYMKPDGLHLISFWVVLNFILLFFF